MKDFQQIQHAFASHIRDPNVQPFDYGVEDRRLKVYRELFFNNVSGFVDSAFPVLKSLYSGQAWLDLTRSFFIHHQCRSPLFVDISKEFVEYLANEHEALPSEPVFAAELAHYEWLELDISVRKGEAPHLIEQPLQPESEVVMSPVASLVSYQYPVHQISPDYQPTEPGDATFIVVYRNQDDKVEFSVLNQATAALLNHIENVSPVKVKAVAQHMTQLLPDLPYEQLERATLEILQDFASKTIIGL
ncbi:DNA-binding domain-containing protein [Alteromonas facilis]|uniref:HvfC family RiPP maturation protein n=1 Tax=Alteromonas facilis TaxID=2048004 RepID=UPI000C292C23|nr:putative DNA-binding domain-containing protein [Alteromonas facilis]